MLYKTLIVLSIVAVFASMLFGSGSGPQMPFNNPNIPNFNNPFITVQTATNDWVVIGPGPNFSYIDTQPNSTSGNAHGCSLSQYWNCVNDPNMPDDNTSVLRNFFGVRPGHGYIFSGLDFNVSVKKPLPYLTKLSLELRCSIPNFLLPVSIVVSITSLGLTSTIRCGNPLLGSKFPVTTSDFNITAGSIALSSFGNITGVFFNPPTVNGNGVNYPIEISTVIIHAVYSNNPPSSCGAGDWLCQWGGVLGFIWNVGVFLFNGVIWFILLIGNIAQLVINYFSVIIWLYNIPGMPLQLQLFIDAILTAWIVVLSVELFKVIKIGG